ncbi:hypothetical protein IHE26_16995 (plasmid) [Plesiomonas shigelloides]|uniref:hypothetical protein n=1 Tax=Plesiomonas shigelloides TaxID=703 RepID=UPI001784D183|nr:hypothetical protein [Plesiomonas shigelloides]QOH81569.1 hypothetical protein IHE26_16995 [Plesiomonas shigelloides]
MKKYVVFALALFSANVFASADPMVDVSNMNLVKLEKVVKKMSKDDYMKLYRHYNQAVLDLWSTGDYKYGFEEPRPNHRDYYNVCNSLQKVGGAGRLTNKITGKEELEIDKENKISVLKICMYAPVVP